jgi:His-Xaa-Ser system protein HxsD
MENVTFGDGFATIELSGRIYGLKAIISAAYLFCDRAYVVLDGEPEGKVLVTLSAKGKTDLKAMVEEFNTQLLHSKVYEQQVEKNGSLREEMLKRALLTNIVPDEPIEDPEGILIPWEEKYG